MLAIQRTFCECGKEKKFFHKVCYACKKTGKVIKQGEHASNSDRKVAERHVNKGSATPSDVTQYHYRFSK